jgi:signal transduction histidine kinase
MRANGRPRLELNFDPGARFRWKYYALASLLVLAAVLLEIGAKTIFHGRAPLTVFSIAVTLAAYYGGFGPGILAAALSAGCIELLFSSAIFTLLPGPTALWPFGVFAIVISLVCENFQRRNHALAQAKELLEAANAKLARRSEELDQSNEELKRFAYALSHDLQSPLRQVNVFTDLLALQTNGSLGEEAAKLMKFIQAGVRQAQALVRRLLEYHVSENQEAAITTTDLNIVLAGALEDIQIAVQEAKAIIAADQLPVVQADGERLRQVFMNLLTNAIKYHGERSPEIHIAASRADEAWLISVADNGIGIDMRYAEKIFELCARLHNSSQYEGSGIGLAICRSIIQRHGGRIWVESELGYGSTFYFTLPIRANL